MKGDISMRDRGYGRDVVRPKAKKRKRRGVSDTTLQNLWRAVVRKEWGGRCAFQTYPYDSMRLCKGDLQCHHIIKRARPHLHNVPSNGILLCQEHHNWAHTSQGRRAVEDLIGENKRLYLVCLENQLFPEYLREIGKTRTEYLAEQKAYLQKLLDTYGSVG